MNPVPFRESLKVWTKVALYSFGGPAGQIAVMHKVLVEEKKWVSENRFLHALNYCMLLPGPEAQQLATYIGWLLHKTMGGIAAGTLFVLPGFLSILALSIMYAVFYDVWIIQAVFFGIKPAVLAIVVGAVIKIGKRALKNEVMAAVALLSFIAIFFFNAGFPYIVITAGLLGFLGGKIFPEKFCVIGEQPVSEISETSGTSDNLFRFEKPSAAKTIFTVLFWLALWLFPVGILFLIFGKENVFVQQSLFFSRAAVVTFGGAYSVLAYIAQKAVETYGWLKPGEMLDGLGMAETTPGPLIQVVQFVGFMGAFRNAGSLHPLAAGILASIIVTWVTFIPSFLYIFTGAPFIEHFRGNKNLSSALSGITAAVVGVMLNLGIWFSLNVLFAEVHEINFSIARLFIPDWKTVHYGALALTLLAFLVFFVLKWDMLKTIAVCMAGGMAWHFFLL
ncbi:MAG TPA: chromate efflux transporter [Chitinophagales bacterium]|nr:chromate efflux transporter [Chitinophagales bacterium]